MLGLCIRARARFRVRVHYRVEFLFSASNLEPRLGLNFGLG